MLKVVGQILNYAVLLGLVILALLLIVTPLSISFALDNGFRPNQSELDWILAVQRAQFPGMIIFVATWVFFVGTCFASFLNVVAWRVPRGKSILGSSHCPQCNIRLRFPQSNVPVLGWLKNGGRCVNCDLPIPVRYLIAELALGSTFLILFAVLLFGDGAAIPFRHAGPIEDILFNPPWGLLVTLIFHLTVLSVIFTLAIAATEKFAAPVSIVAFGILAAIGFQATSFTLGIANFRLGDWQHGIRIFDSGNFIKLLESPADFGIAAGLGIVAAVLCFLVVHFLGNRESHGVFASLLLIGICFGWQAVLSITVFFLLISLILHIDACGNIFLATLVHLCLWRLQTDCQWWPGPASGLQQLICGVGYVVVLAGLQSFVRSRPSPPQNDLPITASGLE